MKDHNLMPYPATLPAEEAMTLLVSALRGEPVDVPECVHVGWCAVGYGLALGFPHTHEGPPKAVSAASAADMIEATLKGDGVKALDWTILIPVILDLIRRFLNR